jgi:hypothetical protein
MEIVGLHETSGIPFQQIALFRGWDGIFGPKADSQSLAAVTPTLTGQDDSKSVLQSSQSMMEISF